MVGEAFVYGDYYRRFRDAIKAKYPQITVIMSMFWSGLNPGAIARAGDANIDIVDEHSYRPSGWIRTNFDYFDRYQWHLDERPLRKDNEINPDVLGYIFEKFINQKQMGAYYTKEDITEYISRNTIVPFLFDAAQYSIPSAFKPGGPIWSLPVEA